MDAPLSFRLGEIPEGVSQHRAEVLAQELDLPSEHAQFLEPTRITLEISRSGEQMRIRGQAVGQIRQQCVRCLGNAESGLTARIDVVARGKENEEGETEPPDGMIYYGSEVLDLADEVRDVILLEIPTQPLCRPECAGLCQRCGADLNTGPCGCREEDHADPRWAALKKMRAKQPGSKD